MSINSCLPMFGPTFHFQNYFDPAPIMTSGLLNLGGQVVRIKVITQEINQQVNSAMDMQHQITQIAYVEFATDFPSELLYTIDGFLNEVPLPIKNPGAKADQSLDITPLPADVRLQLGVQSCQSLDDFFARSSESLKDEMNKIEKQNHIAQIADKT